MLEATPLLLSCLYGCILIHQARTNLMFITDFTHRCINEDFGIYLTNTSVQKVNVLILLADAPACDVISSHVLDTSYSVYLKMYT